MTKKTVFIMFCVVLEMRAAEMTSYATLRFYQNEESVSSAQNIACMTHNYLLSKVKQMCLQPKTSLD